MLNYVWAFMIVVGVLVGGIRGGEIVSLIAGQTIDSAKEAIELCIVMLGVVGLWNGIMNIAREALLIDKWTKGLDPVISFLFPLIPREHPVRKDIASNMIANILGLGWAATPAGLRAMEGLAKLNDERCMKSRLLSDNKKSFNGAGIATDEMCTLLVVNISSLQLIPVNIIAYRSQYGSADPTGIMGPGLLATAITTIIAVVFCKLMQGKNEKKHHI